jgi:hypothetical protein
MRIFSGIMLPALAALSRGLWRTLRSPVSPSTRPALSTWRTLRKATFASFPPQETTWESLRQRAWTFRVIW